MERMQQRYEEMGLRLARRWGLVGVLVGLVILAAAVIGAAGVQSQAVAVGLVFDNPAGAVDKSFNQMAYQGLLQAEADLGVVGTIYTPTSEADYEPLLEQCVDDGNDLCLSVGYLMAGATWDAAAANPGVDFAIVDVGWDSYPSNLRGMEFADDEVGYLAGTLAGLMTSSDVVGAVGGMQIPPVQAFLEPYRYGAGCANPDARVIITYTGTFVDPDLGAQGAQAQMAQGADVIFAVAGPTGSGAILTATQSGAWGIGVDIDEYYTTFGGGSVPGSDRLLTSAMKRIDNAVYDTIADEVVGAFTPGTALYNLAVDGVGLAPFHEAEPSVPPSVVQALNVVKAGLLSGTIDPWDSCAPPTNVGLVFDNPAGAGNTSFNWMAYQGLLRAEANLGVVGTIYTPTTEFDYESLLQRCVDDGNGLCLSVGYLMSDATWNAAAANPGIDFAIVDHTWDSYPDNLRGLAFASEQVGYLAGTLAGLMTASDVVGGVGGMQIPPVQAFLEPYRYGAGCANPGVRVIITYTGTFTDPDLGAQVAQAQMAQGADVIFGAGGPTGSGGILTAAQSGAWGIGVDIDEYYTTFGGGSVPGSDKLLTSAIKRIDNAVYDTIDDAVAGIFTPGTVVYDLSVDGVDLAPFHEADPSIPQVVKDAVEAVRQGILSGSIDVWQTCAGYRILLPVVERNSSN